MKLRYRSPHRKEYRHNRPKQIAACTVLIVALFVISVYSLRINSFELTFAQAWEAVYNRIMGIPPSTYMEGMIDYVAIDVNAPRAFAAVFIGTILSIAGAVMQTVTRNPLAEPYTIGISSAALFGVTISIIYGICIVPGLSGTAAKGINAFVFAMIPAMAIVLISSAKKLSSNMMILVGIGMMYMFSSVTTFMKFNASEEDLEEIYIWGLGTLSQTTWDELLPMCIAAALLFFGFLALSGRINALMAGDSVCHSLGVNPICTRIVCFVIVSVGVAVSVCFAGTLGFVGLVAPHIARLFVGNNNRSLIPVSAIVGALLILVSDVVVRSLPGGLPAGVITALIGSPMFLYFLFMQRKNSTF